MDYQRIYNELIQKRNEQKITPNVYGERHHIIPICMGGSNKKDNIVKLTAKEHYIAHALLYHIYKTSKLAHAWFSMTRISENQERFITSRQYEMAKKHHIEHLKINNAGKLNPFYGKKHNKETCKKISNGILNSNWTPNQNQIDNWIEKVAKLPMSDKNKRKVSQRFKGKILLKNKETGEIISVDKSNSLLYDEQWSNPLKGKIAIHHKKTGKVRYIQPNDEYDSDSWEIGTNRKQKHFTCEYCGKNTIKTNLIRWHGKGKCI